MSTALVLGLLAAGTAAAGSPDGAFHFYEVGASRGIGPYVMASGMGSGVAAADFDDDGDVDLFVPTAYGVPDQLYRNLGNGFFQESAAAAGVDSLDPHRSALWLDLDGDTRLDLVVAGGDCFSTCGADIASLIVYRQTPDGTFEDFTEASGLAVQGVPGPTRHVSGITAGDLNRDGWLDIFFGVWFGPPSLYLNDGDGTFTDISVTCGFQDIDHHWQPMMHDFDGDGWLDIYIAIDFFANKLYLNQQDGTFLERAPGAGLHNAMNDMGMALGDCDNDGDFEIYVTNVYDYQGQTEHNVLFRNDSVAGDPAFTEIAMAAGVAEGGWGWGATFLDADNDGDVDLAATNGWDFLMDSSRLFLNQGTTPIAFVDVSDAVGFNDQEWGSSLIAFDLERDGDLDLVQTCAVGGPLRLLVNAAGPDMGHSLVVRPRRPGPNHRAIGTTVRVRTGTTTMTRLITAGTSFLGQEPAEAHFGLGTATHADEVTITWPDGSSSQWLGVAADQVVTLSPGGLTGDLNGDGVVNFEDLLALLSMWGPCAPDVACSDLDDDGLVGFLDLLIVLANWS